jgi:hypothetical protein
VAAGVQLSRLSNGRCCVFVAVWSEAVTLLAAALERVSRPGAGRQHEVLGES